MRSSLFIDRALRISAFADTSCATKKTKDRKSGIELLGGRVACRILDRQPERFVLQSRSVSRLTKIISGGQTGVDQAVLRAAKDCGLEIGGWCPPGRVCDKGVIPADFPLQETPEERSPNAPDVPRSQRTEWNVRDSDATLVILSGKASHPPSRGFGVASSDAATEEKNRDPGTPWTVKCAARYKRPLLICDVEDPNAKYKIQRWLEANAIKTLNVAGPSEATSPGTGDRSYALLLKVFTFPLPRKNSNDSAV